MRLLTVMATCCLIVGRVSAQNPEPLKKMAITDLDAKHDGYKKIALQIWDYAEVGYKEVKSSALLQQTLKESGFTVEAGVAGIPTAFVATYGKGEPVIGILAEFDALPGMGQEASPVKKEIAGKDAGQACGHHLFGTASVAAGIEIKKLMDEKKLTGTVKVFGTPAEEGGSGKVYMVREGLFKGVTAVVHWHPGDRNAVMDGSSLANISAKFRFHGLSAHAAAAPDKGRSALDAVEAMDFMVNMMREHVPSDTRIHYVITNGGKAPNVVPDFAESYFYVRSPSKDNVRSIFDRIVKAGEGAALGTGTKMEFEITGGVYDLLVNHTLSAGMQKNLDLVGGVKYDQDETTFATKLQESFAYKAAAPATAATVAPLNPGNDMTGSTDVGDVSWTVPTVGLSAATWVPGTPAHSWQAVACGGMEIGIKGMMVAAKTMTLTVIDLLTNKSILDKAAEEFRKSHEGDYVYKALLGDRKPALNYRN